MKIKITSIIFILSFLVILMIINIFGISSPIVKSDSYVTARVGELFLYQIKAVDGFGSELSYNLLQAPDGMSIDDSTGLIEWHPDDSQIGRNKVRLKIINNKYQRVLELIGFLSAEDEIKLDASTIHEFIIQVIDTEVETIKIDYNLTKDCSEDESINWNSLYLDISGTG